MWVRFTNYFSSSSTTNGIDEAPKRTEHPIKDMRVFEHFHAHLSPAENQAFDKLKSMITLQAPVVIEDLIPLITVG